MEQVEQVVADVITHVSNETIEAPVQLLAQQPSRFPWIVAITILCLLIMWKMAKKKKAAKSNIFLVGERGSGKTKLFYRLTNGKEFETVPSCVNNQTEVQINGSRKLLIDVTGANHTKEEFLARLGTALRVILVADGSNTKNIASTAELLYRISVSKAYQLNEPDLLIVLTRSNAPDFMGCTMFKKQLEDEIERIKLSRKAMMEQRETEDDTLREQRDRYSLRHPVVEADLFGKIDKVEEFMKQGHAS